MLFGLKDGPALFNLAYEAALKTRQSFMKQVMCTTDKIRPYLEEATAETLDVHHGIFSIWSGIATLYYARSLHTYVLPTQSKQKVSKDRFI